MPGPAELWEFDTRVRLTQGAHYITRRPATRPSARHLASRRQQQNDKQGHFLDIPGLLSIV